MSKAPAKRAQKRTVGVKKPTEIKITEAKEFQPIKALSGFTLQEKPVVTEEQAKLLLQIKTLSDKPFIDINDYPTLFQILVSIRSFGFEAIYADMTMKQYINANDYIFSKMTSERKDFVMKHVSDLIVEKVEKGVFKCHKCLNEGRDPSQTTSINQASRGDEPSVNLVSCNICGMHWRTR